MENVELGNLGTISAAEAITAIYIGYYDRAPDPAGLDFWLSTLGQDDGEGGVFGLEDIATAFATEADGEAQREYDFFTDPTTENAEEFLESLYQNIFGRAPDDEGRDFWLPQIEAVAEGEQDIGDIILLFIRGAQNNANGNDLDVINNKIDVAEAWTAAAREVEGFTYDNTDSPEAASAKAVLDGVDATAASVAEGISEVNEYFEPLINPAVPGEEFFLTSSTDVIAGTENNDTFNAYLSQNPFVGGVSNSLSSADRLDGGAGEDSLYAELSVEFVGVDADDSIDVQPRIKNIEKIQIEAREGEDSGQDDEGRDFDGVVVDAKNITDHEEIGSYYSDGDLKIENLTTLTSNGTARDTSEITITMDHTDNFNSDDDASDLIVLFDNDYLLAGETSEGVAEFFLLDEKAELNRLDGEAVEGRLDEIDKNGIRFALNGEEITLQFDPALIGVGTPDDDTVDTHQQFVNALDADLQAKIADGTLPQGTTVELFDYATVLTDDEGKTLNRTGLNDGTLSELIPAIRVVVPNETDITALGFVAPDEVTGAFDVFGEFRDDFERNDDPISINIDLEKVGRGGDGGDLIIGGKAQSVQDGIAGGIEVFNINVKGVGGSGADAKPSSLGTIGSTLGALEVINIATHSDFVDGDSFASLEVRDGFEAGDLRQINANDFLGNLTLDNVVNADSIQAAGGGDVFLGLEYDGTEEDEAYSVTTGAGDDVIDIIIDGDALDYANSSLTVSTGAGDDEVYINSDEFNGGSDFDVANERLNQAILQNASIDTGAGDDYVELGEGSKGNFNINGGEGNDFINTGGYGDDLAGWAFNFDNERVDVGSSNPGDNDLPGVQTSLAYLGGATVTVTLSGAGVDDSPLAGGGVMSNGDAAGDTGDGDAIDGDNGYEASFTIGNLINGNSFYGDQRDVNAAVIAAIENDPVLSELLTVRIAENNTLVIESTTSGNFDEDDLRIDIAQAGQTTWTGVQSEARSVFSDSGITVTSIASANAASPNDLTTSDNADMWWDGLSVAGDDNSSTDNRFESGDASIYETDNVINGGNGDDLIVLSTDANTFGGTFDFTLSSNNKLQNQASNETIVMTGSDFGDDTVMNFTAGEMTSASQHTFNLTFQGTVEPSATDADITRVTIEDIVVDGEEIVVVYEFSGPQDAATLAGNLVGAINTAAGRSIASTSGTDISVAGVNVDASGVTLTDIIIQDVDTDTGDTTDFTTDDFVSDEGSETVDVPTDVGLDFLDFTSYLTSQEDISSGAGDSSDSNVLIPVTLDYNEDATATNDVEANEVVAVRMTDDAAEGETFSALSASVVANLFNNSVDTDNEWGGLTEANLNAATYQKTDQEALIGDGKAIFMVENASNLGEYKVFELTWSGDNASPSGDVVSATQIGSLDFGTSLTGLSEANLIGSEDYANLDLNLFA